MTPEQRWAEAEATFEAWLKETKGDRSHKAASNKWRDLQIAAIRTAEAEAVAKEREAIAMIVHDKANELRGCGCPGYEEYYFAANKLEDVVRDVRSRKDN